MVLLNNLIWTWEKNKKEGSYFKKPQKSANHKPNKTHPQQLLPPSPNPDMSYFFKAQRTVLKHSGQLVCSEGSGIAEFKLFEWKDVVSIYRLSALHCRIEVLWWQGRGSPWKHCSAVVCRVDVFPRRDNFSNRFLHHRPVWPTFDVVNRDQNWSGNFPCHMRLRAPLSFVYTFIFGQLFYRKHHFEDSFVPFRENREDAWGDAMQQPFGTLWSPPAPPVRGSWKGWEQLVQCFEARGWGSMLGVWLGLACLGPPPLNRPSPALTPSIGLKNPEAALLCVGGWSKTQPLPLTAPASPRRARSSVGLAPGK